MAEKKRQAGYEEDVPPGAFAILSDAEVEAHLLRRAMAEGDAEDEVERQARVTEALKKGKLAP